MLCYLRYRSLYLELEVSHLPAPLLLLLFELLLVLPPDSVKKRDKLERLLPVGLNIPNCERGVGAVNELGEFLVEVGHGRLAENGGVMGLFPGEDAVELIAIEAVECLQVPEVVD